MPLSSFIKNIFRNINPFKAKALEGVSSIESFYRFLERERCRSDRSGLPFALVSFEAKSPDMNGNYAEKLTHVLCSRIRTTDEIGWIDHKHIGLVLYNTEKEGAMSFITALEEAISDKASNPDCRVYIYPADRGAKGHHDGSAQQGKIDNDSNEDGSLNNGELKNNLQSNSDKSIFRSSLTSSNNFTEAAHDISPLLSRKIPVWKRAADIVGSLVGLIVLSPVMLLTAIAIKLDSKGPIIFRQVRIGSEGKTFSFFKFRSMYDDCDQTVHQEHIEKLSNGEAGLVQQDDCDYSSYKLDNDERVTKVGKFLRRTSLDEFPQLINVLKGEMSLVGPRPYPVYQEEISTIWQRYRIMVRPGITGLAQVDGRYGKSYIDAYRLDLQYIKSFSFWLDIKILFKTIRMVISARGAQ
jgi:lipopolysaccharide/colanic/teichoic acid biosynthesis glycosyltransferase